MASGTVLILLKARTRYLPGRDRTIPASIFTTDGTVALKLRSAEWVIENSGRKWTRLIKQAIAWHFGDPPGDIGQTQEFIRYILKKAGLSE